MPTTTEFLQSLLSYRGTYVKTSGTSRMLELYGATIIEPTAFRPDPLTYRLDYYYDINENALFKKVINVPGKHAYWKLVS